MTGLYFPLSGLVFRPLALVICLTTTKKEVWGIKEKLSSDANT